MKFGVVRFPGSNCDQDCVVAINSLPGASAEPLWHKETSVAGFDAIVLPGGFSYGDYLRCGAIARFSPVMTAVRAFADAGGPVIGICNGFQILCEAGLLPGALIRNRGLRFICEFVHVRIESDRSPFTRGAPVGRALRIPIAHGEGCFFADKETLRELEDHAQVILRYCNADAEPAEDANPNGSLDNIAGICNRAGNILGLMPHPERACDPLLGSTDGRAIFQSLLS